MWDDRGMSILRPRAVTTCGLVLAAILVVAACGARGTSQWTYAPVLETPAAASATAIAAREVMRDRDEGIFMARSSHITPDDDR